VVRTSEARAAARAAVEPQYDYTSENAIAIAGEQQVAFEDRVGRIDTAFAADLSPQERSALLETAVPGLSDGAQATLVALEQARWPAVRTEAARVLDATLRAELRDTEVAEARTDLSRRMAGGLDDAERMLAAELIGPLLVPNSSFSPELTAQARDRAAEAVEEVRVQILNGEVIVREGTRLDEAQIEEIDALGLSEATPDVASFVGWLLLAVLIVVMLLTWIWRFRPKLWHRDNVLILIGMLLVGASLALKVTEGRPTLPFFLPTAAIAMLLAVLLDASVATIVIAFLALIGGAINDGSLEFSSFIFLGGMAGIVAIRRGDRLQAFLQASVAVFIVNALVVTVFSLFGARDLRGILELWFASAASAAGSGIAAVGSFAVLGSVFGILTVFQLLELANPSQPLLRRLLVETPGTYHHSLMVGNLAERAAEAIGGDPLVTRVAAYYHDIGKLANPLAFIENQAGGENIHDQLEPQVSAGILKQHVVDGIDLAYKARLPKALIAYIPQHHGTAIMSYFFARAKELAPPGTTVDERRFRHSGPKPQSREAALIMLADGVEASVRSLASRDEPAIRAMVTRIIEERTADGQFDECDLTMRDLERVREAFVEQLLGMYHTRIAYPQNTVVELESRRQAAGGGGGAAS
jgi:putative nucleotidyltransferase with HDIG domain